MCLTCCVLLEKIEKKTVDDVMIIILSFISRQGQ
jgi:hypothetical protein